MTFTIWQKKIIFDVLGSMKHAHISEIEQMLDLRKAFKMTDRELSMIKRDEAQSHEQTCDITLKKNQLQLVYDKLGSDLIQLPVNEHSLTLVNKIKDKLENGEEV